MPKDPDDAVWLYCARFSALVKDLVSADPRTQEQIAAAAWPDSYPLTATRRLQRAMSGDWPTRDTIVGLVRTFNCEIAELLPR